MAQHRQRLADHLDYPAPAAPEADAWHDLPAEDEPDLLRRLAPDLLMPDEEPAAVRDRTRQLVSSLKPWDAFELWLTGRVALQEIRLTRCRAQELLVRDRLARRALLCWDEDRRAEVCALGAKLGRRPDAVAPELGRSRHGCEWLLARWDALAATLDEAGTWDDEQRRRALDLLGVPRADRSGRIPLDPPAGVEVADHLRAVLTAEVDRLRALKTSALDELDALDREAAALGVAPDDQELARLRRAERSHERSLQMYLSRFKKTRSGAYLTAEPEPLRRPESIRPTPASEPPPAPIPEPESDLPAAVARPIPAYCLAPAGRASSPADRSPAPGPLVPLPDRPERRDPRRPDVRLPPGPSPPGIRRRRRTIAAARGA